MGLPEQVNQRQAQTGAEPAPANVGRKGSQADDHEPGGEAFGRSFTTNSGLAESTGVGRKDTPDAIGSEQGIAGGPDTGDSITAKPQTDKS